MTYYPMEMPQASVQSATALTDSILVDAGASSVVKVAAVYVMTDTAGTITLEADDTVDVLLWEVYPAANGGMQMAAPEGQYLFQTGAGQDLLVTSSITGEHFVSVLYVKE